jgi:uncharacterized linocin/CFP29 family protein
MFISDTGTVMDDGAIVLNHRGHGEVGEVLNDVRFEPRLRRPFILNGRPHVTIDSGKYKTCEKTGRRIAIPMTVPVSYIRNRYGIDNPIWNATLLQKDAWIEIDRAVIRATRKRLRAWTDLASRNPRGGFDAMGRLTLEYTAITDVHEALVDMDGVAEGRTDRPELSIRSVPLPITHSDFYYTQREIAVSRRTSTPLDITSAEMAGRRVAEMIEKTLIGIETGVTAGTRSTGPFPHTGTSTVYGYTNFPYRVTKTNLNTPTGANPQDVMSDVLQMVSTMEDNGFYGPYILYHSTGYSQYLRNDYFRTGSTSAVRSLRQRLMEIENIADIRRLDFLTSGYQLILVQMDPEVAQAIDGMGITTVMWEEKGGALLKFKVMCIQVPLLKAPANGIGGILHATTA